MGVGNDDSHSPFFDEHHRYDVNSRIMITAIISLSFVVFLVTLLHIYARCVLRRHVRRQNALRHLGFFAAPTVVVHRPAEPPKTGLDPSVIAALPASTFKKSREIECAVCLSVLEDGETVRILPNCEHTFHLDCIDVWLGSNSTCPVCRTEAKPKLVAEPREGLAVPAGGLPSAPPQEGLSSDGGGTQCPPKMDESSSRLSSFRRILSRERSSRRMNQTTQARTEQDQDGLPDLERQ